MSGLVLLLVASVEFVAGQQVGQRIGPATDDPRGMAGQQGFPPGAAVGDAYYAKLTVRHTHFLNGVRCRLRGGVSMTDRPIGDPRIVTQRPRHMEAQTMA